MTFRSNRLAAVLTACSLGVTSTGSFADDLFDMLKRMSEADQNHNYQGNFILRKSDNLSTMHVTHGVDDKGVWESLESLNGESRMVFRHNNRVITVFPERELVTIRQNAKKQSLHQKLPDNIDQLAQFYTMQRLDDDRIANHQTLVVDLMPKDEFRYGYRYWVDKKTGMLLRCDLIDEEKAVVEQMMFTSLDYLTDVPARTFEMQQFDQFRQQLDEETQAESGETGSDGWEVGHLPRGFMLTQSIRRYSKPPANATEAGSRSPDILHLVYSDGLASVSVFIEQNQGEGKHLQGAASMGAVNAFGSEINGYIATVVGEVPAKTVQLMAQSTVRLAP